MKKFWKILRTAIIGSLWTVVFLYVANFVFINVWSFDLLNSDDWRIISKFWNDGGKIKSGRDYLFLLSFVSVAVLWIWGWRRGCRLNFVEILLAPLEYYNSLVIKKCSSGSRIVLKNIGVKEEKTDQAEIIKAKLKEVEKQIDAGKETSKIREVITGKITTKP